MKKVNYVSVLIIAMISFGLYYYFSIHPKQLKNDIYQQNGYEVREVEDKYVVRFKLDEKWLDIPNGKTKFFNEKLGGKNDSTVIIKSVQNQSDRYSFNFNIDHDLNSNHGKFLSHYKISKRGDMVSFLSRKDLFTFYDQNKQVIDQSIVSGGSGPGELFGGNFNLSFLELVKIIEVQLYLYEYEKL